MGITALLIIGGVIAIGVLDVAKSGTANLLDQSEGRPGAFSRDR